MIKFLLILTFFCAVVGSLKPTPSVQELTAIVDIHCKDICKGGINGNDNKAK
jgi:hypothetical protein